MGRTDRPDAARTRPRSEGDHLPRPARGADGRRLARRGYRGHLRGIIMAKDTYRGPMEQVDECCYRIPKSYKPGMRVDGLIFADETLMRQIKNDQAPEQVANVAFLPGIVG